MGLKAGIYKSTKGNTEDGGNCKTLKNRLVQDKIDFSHVNLGIDNRRGVHYESVFKRPLEEVMVEKSDYPRTCLKKRIIKENILEYKCNKCGIENQWQGNKLVLVLDHINGVHNDHRFENLRFLCPNCNSQTETFSGRNKKYK